MAVSSKSKLVVEHNDMKVTFDNKGHVYKVYRNGKLAYKPISVTTLIHKYQKPFDLEGMSLKCAQKEGVTQEEIKKRWAKINRTACGYGTKMHKVAEDVFNGVEVDSSKFTKEENAVYSQITTVIDKMWKRPYVYESEKIVFDPSINVAGTIDLLGRNPKTNDYVIVDWKTNKRIRMSNEWGDTFLSPMEDLADCEFNLYGLQLSLYEKILKDGGFVPKDSNFKKFICHFHPVDGVHFHEVTDDVFVPQLSKMLKDWDARQNRIKELSASLPDGF